MQPALGLTLPRDIPLDTLYHVAFAVPDLEAAMAQTGDSLGLTWASVREAGMALRGPDGREAVNGLRAVYSRQGPTYWELVWGPPGSRFAVGAGPRFDHAGIFVEHVGQEVERLERTGWTTTHRAVTADSRTGVAYLSNALGIHLELLPLASKETIQNWLFPE
jgi:hypothetical protein